ncbi:hypothetical protein [Halegenticoccus soli]|nr:hypothetical protein [Halegenticoccus soli]
MSLVTRIIGANWRCKHCGREYWSNKRQCGECGSTIFVQVN